MPITPRPTERADAARNRARILEAAGRLFAERGVEAVTMDEIAAAAGVGKGTLFRRFGDRAGLVLALLEERTETFQEGFIRGEPPLGPGAPPVERLVAFGHAMLDFLEDVGGLILVAETGSPGARFRSAPNGVFRAHLHTLIRAGAPELDAGYMADVLLTALSAEPVMHQRRGRGISLDELKAGWASLARSVLG